MKYVRPRARKAGRSEPEPAETAWDPTSWNVTTVLQPIIDVHRGTVVGYEALARFDADDPGTVLDRLAEARAQGHGAELEAVCLRAALRRRVDVRNGAWLSMNVSAGVLGHSEIQEALNDDLTGIVLEITEEIAGQPGCEVAALSAELSSLRQRGASIAVDDASTGHAALLRLIRLRPDIVKLDASLIANAADRVEQSAVIEALVTLSRRIGARVLGEGVETVNDLRALADLDVDYAQGWVIAHPAPDPPAAAQQAVTACRVARRDVLRAHAVRTDPTNADVDYPATALHRITAALAASVTVDELTAILERTATSLGVDIIGISTLAHGYLQEIAAVGAAKDEHRYPLTEFTATRTALQTNTAVEIHADDDTADSAERRLLSDLDLASLLIVPLTRGGHPIGILEFNHRAAHRWRTSDIQRAQSLADHIAHALQRINTEA